MSLADSIIFWGGGVTLGLAALLALLRALFGPTALDRMIASDVILTIVVLLMGAEMMVNHHTNSIPVMIGVSATAALATITVARYVQRKDIAAAESDEIRRAAEIAEQVVESE